MKRFLVGLLLVSAACGDTRLDKASDPRCGTECFVGPGIPNVGPCRYGTWQCDDEGEVTECFGQVSPQPAVCGQFDNSCDGKQDYVSPRECSTVCGSGVEFCRDGEWSACTAKAPQQETCNALDDDCDGSYDEVEDIAIQPCYSLGLLHPSLSFGECRFGVSRCNSGTLTCQNEVTPQKEECDGKDNDCDGLVDEGTTIEDQDIVFVIDFSGSMQDKISNIQRAIRDWSVKYGADKFRVALVGVPDGLDSSGQVPKLMKDLSPVVDFMRALDDRQALPLLGFEEPTLDALVMIGDYAHNPLALSWRSGSDRTVFMFADEIAQSYFDPKITSAEAIVALQSSSPDLRIYIWSDPQWLSGYQAIPLSFGGKNYDIFMDLTSMKVRLDEAIQTQVCY